jgi:hypothetical protein
MKQEGRDCQYDNNYMMISVLPLGTLHSVASLFAKASIIEIWIGNTRYGMPFQLRAMHFICRDWLPEYCYIGNGKLTIGKLK